MSNLHYMLVEQDGEASVTAFIPGQSAPLVASTEAHGKATFDKIVALLKADDPSAADLFDLSVAVARNFQSLSERVSVAHGKVFFDGDEVHGSIAKHIIRFLDIADSNWISLVEFMEKVAQNPTEHSREQLYEWLDRRDFTITPDGDLIGYKGVNADLKSVRSGPGIVNGEEVNGHLDNSPGNTVEIARSRVQHDPAVGCASGLHVGTYEYAKSWGAVVLEVVVNPRDVVSVPTDCDAQKVRVSRYTVVKEVERKYDSPLRYGDEDYWDDEDDVCPDCGEPDCDLW